MRAANLEVGYVVRYGGEPFLITDRAVEAAVLGSAVLMGLRHSGSAEDTYWLAGRMALIYSNPRDDVIVLCVNGSANPADWAEAA